VISSKAATVICLRPGDVGLNALIPIPHTSFAASL